MDRKLRYSFCILLIVTLLGGCVNDTPSGKSSLIAVGDALPDFSVTMNDGRVVTTDALLGSPSLILLFTVECPDCRRALPVMQQLWQRNQGLQILCIARNQDAGTLSAYWAENHLTLPYSPQPDASVYHLFAKSGVPRLYISDSNGTVVSRYDDTDFPSVAEIEEVLKRL